jgi:hypothetical protein
LLIWWLIAADDRGPPIRSELIIGKNEFSNLGTKFEIKQNMVKKVKKGKPKWIEKKDFLVFFYKVSYTVL